MELEIAEQSPSVTQLALKGQLDTQGVDRIETRLTALFARGGHGILDLSEVTFLGSLGIRLFVTVAKAMDRRGTRLVLVAPRKLVEQALRHSSVDQIIPVTSDLAAARALLAS